MKDVAADGAVLVDPFSVDSIREGYLKILGMTEQERQEMIDKGQKNCKRFEAKKIAKKYLDIYKEVYKTLNHK